MKRSGLVSVSGTMETFNVPALGTLVRDAGRLRVLVASVSIDHNIKDPSSQAGARSGSCVRLLHAYSVALEVQHCCRCRKRAAPMTNYEQEYATTNGHLQKKNT